MLVCEYTVGYDAQRVVRGLTVFRVMLDGGAVVCCDLDRKIDGVSLVLGLAFNEDIDEDPETPPREWVVLPDMVPEVVKVLERGESVSLMEETTGNQFSVRLSENQQGLAI